eukprot:gnl/Dysnectes_brevis/1542_a1750_1226.p1 GENE.gnl/Dysnectes_brevis/1542_a1750_1226~~gnl/Dysnectes_brevis/1542_a1750_1226.p1  ORF type:complete len:530 (-),score=152.13 gnl/Dysnectes_brevis/1542_a1750_1226:116-1705(-)
MHHITAKDIPNLPGNTFPDPSRTNFAVSHVFDVAQKVPVVNDFKVGSTTPFVPVVVHPATSAPETIKVDPFIPDFVKLDRVVLRFFCHFVDRVHESQFERERVRHVRLDFYMVDGTASVQEKAQENSGIPQGQLVNRHLIPKDYRDESQGYLSWKDVKLGGTVSIYGRVYHVDSANPSTMKFLQQQEVDVEAAQDAPEDPYLSTRHATEASMRKTHVTKHVPSDRLARFLRHDRQVLRFYAFWDQRDRLYGELRRLIIHYFLADSTVEVLEVLPPNSGRDPFPQFLRRQRLPKRHTGVQLAEHAEETLEFYTAEDFGIGYPISVFKRNCRIYDCDEFTRSFLVEELGRSPAECAPQEQPLLRRREAPAPLVPPHTGIGSEEDSLASCKSIFPKRPRRDLRRWHRFDKVIIRYSTRFVKGPDGGEPNITQRDRRFLLSFYLENGTMSLFETSETVGAGAFGRKFLERMAVTNPATGKHYDWSDLHVGKVLGIHGHWVEVIDIEAHSVKIVAELERAGLDGYDHSRVVSPK